MAPDGTISLTEIVAAGADGGKGTLTFQGHAYPFRLVGGVTGGGGAADTQAAGEVYGLHNISDSKGCIRKAAADQVWPCQAPAICGSQRGGGGAALKGHRRA